METALLKFQETFVLVDFDAPDAEAIIQALAERLHKASMVSEDYGKATIERERQHATGLPTKPFPIAFPHADADGVVESALAVANLKAPVVFKNMADPDEDLAVELVIMLANKTPEEQIETLRNLAELFGQPDKLSELKNIRDAAAIVSWLSKELELNP